MLVLLLKVSLALTIPCACLPLMRHTSSAMRHLLCAMALGGALLMPLTLLIPSTPAMTIRIAATTSKTAGIPQSTTHIPWLALWAAGTVILVARLLLGYWRVASVVRNAEPGDGFGMADITTPFVSGLFRPVILIPRTWPKERLELALRHERAHVERKDLWTNLMAHIACAVYWFHPLVWAVAARMRREQETACDDVVVCSGLEPVVYAEALVAAARHNPLTSSLIGCHMLTQKTLKSRIARLLDGSLPRTSSTAALRRATLIGFAALGCIALLNAADDQVYKVGAGISPPHVTFKTDPIYTEEARAAKIDGAVLLTVVIGTDGLAHDINVVKSLDAGLDVKAVEAVQKWHFDPGKKDGEPVAVRATIEVNFRLL